MDQPPTLGNPALEQSGAEQLGHNRAFENEVDTADTRVLPEHRQPTANADDIGGNLATATIQAILDECIDPQTFCMDMVKDYLLPDLQVVPVMNLRWDTQQKWGQIRAFKQDLVDEYIKEIEKELPRKPVRVLIRNMGAGM